MLPFSLQVGLRGSFENSAIKLHYYWDKLNYKPQDEIDKGLAQLFLDKSIPNELYESLIQKEQDNQNKDNENNNDDSESEQKLDLELDLEAQGFVYYKPQLPEGLKLKPEQLEILRNKLTELGKVYEERKEKMSMMQRSIQNLYDELDIPEEDRIKLTDSLDQEYMDKVIYLFYKNIYIYLFILICSNHFYFFSWKSSLKDFEKSCVPRFKKLLKNILYNWVNFGINVWFLNMNVMNSFPVYVHVSLKCT